MRTYTLEFSTDASGNPVDASGFDFVTLSEVKSYLAVDGSGDDSLITDMINAVAADLEQKTGQALGNRTVEFFFDDQEKYVNLPIRPFTSLTSVVYEDLGEASGNLYASGGDFDVFGKTSRIGDYVLRFNKTYAKTTITYVANGYSVPVEFKLALMAMVKVMYNDNRDFDGQFAKKMVYPKETVELIRKYQPIVI